MARKPTRPLFAVEATFQDVLGDEAKRQPEWPDVMNRWGLCLMAQGKLAEAALAFEQSLARHAAYGWAAANLAQARALLGDDEGAWAVARGEAPEPAPGAGAWVRCFLHLVAGRWSEAEEELASFPPELLDRADGLRLRAAVRVATDAPAAKALAERAANALVDHEVEVGESAPWDEGKDVASRLLTLVPGMSSLWLQASTFEARLGRPGLARRAAAVAFLHWADEGSYCEQQGTIAAIEGDDTSAYHWYSRAAAAAPRVPGPHIALAYHWCAQGELGPAERALRTALGLAPRYPDLHLQLGLLERARGDLPGSLASFQRASGINPRYRMARLEEAMALYAMERWEEARSVFRAVMDLGVRSADILLHLGQVEEHLLSTAAAVAAYEEARRLDPDEPLAHERLGQLYFDAGRFREARAAWTRFLEVTTDMDAAQAVRERLARAPGEDAPAPKRRLHDA